jgi:hypothetical protein
MAGVDARDLTARERTALLALMAEARPLTNPDLVSLGLPVIDSTTRSRLTKLGLVDCERSGRTFRHELTDAGWALGARGLEALAPTRGGAALAAVLRAVDRHLSRTDGRPADLFRPDATAEVRRAYAAAVPSPGAWVRLADLRDRVDGVSRPDVDAALVAMAGDDDVRMAPEADQKTLTRRDREAALRLGPKDVHLIAIGTP